MTQAAAEPTDNGGSIDAADIGDAVSTERGRAPGWVVWLLIVLATVVGAGATLNSWVDRQALDTEQWVSVTDDMLADDDIRDALSQYLGRQLFANVDVAGQLESALPGATSALAGPIAATLQSNAVGVVDQALASDRFATLWSEANRTAHSALVRIVRGEDGPVLSRSDGAFVIDLRALLVGVADRLGLPDGVGDRIPDDAGQLVVFESEQLDAVQQAVRVIDLMSLYLFVLVVVLYAAAVYLAIDRRLTLRNTGFAIVVGSVVLLIVRRIALNVSVEQLADAQSGRDAAESVVAIATSLLNELAWAWLALGLLIAVYAMLVGPSRGAVAVRSFIAPVMRNPVSAWALALAVLALYTLFSPGVSIDRWIPALIFIGLFVAAVELLRRQVNDEQRSTPAPSET